MNYRLRSDHLAQVTGCEIAFLAGVIDVARLSSGGSSNGSPPSKFEYTLPHELEAILDCETAQDLVKIQVNKP